MTPAELSIQTNISITDIYNILSDKISITSEVANQLERVLNIPADFWLGKQSNYMTFNL